MKVKLILLNKCLLFVILFMHLRKRNTFKYRIKRLKYDVKRASLLYNQPLESNSIQVVDLGVSSIHKLNFQKQNKFNSSQEAYYFRLFLTALIINFFIKNISYCTCFRFIKKHFWIARLELNNHYNDHYENLSRKIIS